MDYLQYKNLAGDIVNGWNVLNLIINGLPSIQLMENSKDLQLL